MNLIITGACGFIGASLLSNYKVPAYTNLISTDRAKRYGMNFVTVCEGSSISSLSERIFSKIKDEEKCTILHFGGESSTSASFQSCHNNNYLFTKNILDLIAERSNINFNLFFASSASVYGHNVEQSATSPIDPCSFYAESKAKCEEMIVRSKLPNLKYIIGRIFNVVPCSASDAEFESHKKDKTIIHDYYRNSFDFITLFNPKIRVTRDFIGLNILEKYLLNINDPSFFDNSIMNIGSGASVSFLDILNQHMSLYGRKTVKYKEKEFQWESYQKYTKAQ